MSQELTLEVAQEFLKDNDAVRLSKFNSIADAAAVALAKNEIYLLGLFTLFPHPLQVVSGHGRLSRNGSRISGLVC